MSKFNIHTERKFGWDLEDIVKPFIELELNSKLNKYSNQFAIFDYFNKDFEIELKSRRVKYNTYPSTMIGVNKYKKGLEHIRNGKNVYFFFNFTDGLYYYKLEEDSILEIKNGGRRDTGIYKDYCYIKKEQLKKCINQKTE
tara:strand:+ start:49 stop:471 length:423 start_codon:yes stop_codon:yes gene_type:complete